MSADLFGRAFRGHRRDHGVRIAEPLGLAAGRVDGRGVVADDLVDAQGSGVFCDWRLRFAGNVTSRKRVPTPRRKYSTTAAMWARSMSLKPASTSSASLAVVRAGHSRPGRDRVERVAEHVGDDQRDKPAGAAAPGQPAALDEAELAADRVELLDVGAGRAEQRVSRILSSSEISGTGAGSSADPPPVSRQKQKSSGPAIRPIRGFARVPSTPSGRGSLTPAGRAACR